MSRRLKNNLMLNACEDSNALALIVGSLALFGASVFQLWRYQEQAHPVVREIKFTQDTAPMPYVDNGVQVLAISKTRSGEAPWFTFPPEIRRPQIEHLYDTCLKFGVPPSPESNLLKKGVLTRAQLQAFKDDAYEKRWITYHRNGLHSPWSFTKQGEHDLTFCYMRLNGKLPHQDGRVHQKKVAQ